MWLEMLHPEDILEGTRFAAEGGQSMGDDQAEFRMFTAGRQQIWMRQVFRREAEMDGRSHVRGFLLDVTESKKMEEERELSRTELRELAARSQNAREQERVNIARDIHDEMGQALTMMKLDLNWLSGRFGKLPFQADLEPITEKVASMERMIEATLHTVRRVLADLRPPLLDELGLADAIEYHASEFARRAALRCEVLIDREEDLQIDGDAALALFRIFQEITTNIARHAKATRVTVELRSSGTSVVLLVVDNGRGFSEAQIKKKGHFGVLGMQERAWAAGGQVWVESSVGKGTSVRAELPLKQ
jgi:signal transduction histidine kinase